MQPIIDAATGEYTINFPKPGVYKVNVTIWYKADRTTLPLYANESFTKTFDIAFIEVMISYIVRIPIYGGDSPIEGSAIVTIKPDTLPSGVSIKLKIELTAGLGNATFADDTSKKEITKTETIKLKGVDNSDTKDNIKLSASLEDKECSSDVFSVRTWPINFTCKLTHKNRGYGLQVDMLWESESGKESLIDLEDIVISEYITYSVIPNPPFAEADGVTTMADSGKTKRIPEKGFSAEMDHIFDLHKHPKNLVVKNPIDSSYTVTQSYQFMDNVLKTEWQNVPGPGNAEYIITRSITNKGTKFITKKTGQGGPFESSEAIK